MVSKPMLIGAAGLAVALGVASAGASLAQEAAPPAGTPPSWETLTHCAAMANEDARLSCYDGSMRAAGYAPKPAEVAAEKHKRFGLALPDLKILRKHDKAEGTQAAASAAAPAAPAKAEEPEDRITAQLDLVATIPPAGKLLLFTTDGAIWAQTDSVPVPQTPKPGQTMVIRRNTFGGYFCQFDKWNAVRCARKR